MKPESYYPMPGCINCKHVFVLSEYDEGNRYFCHFDKSERPKRGSCYMGEHLLTFEEDQLPWEETMDLFSQRNREWEDWANPREVEPNGRCNEWAEKG